MAQMRGMDASGKKRFEVRDANAISVGGAARQGVLRSGLAHQRRTLLRPRLRGMPVWLASRATQERAAMQGPFNVHYVICMSTHNSWHVCIGLLLATLGKTLRVWPLRRRMLGNVLAAKIFPASPVHHAKRIGRIHVQRIGTQWMAVLLALLLQLTWDPVRRRSIPSPLCLLRQCAFCVSGTSRTHWIECI